MANPVDNMQMWNHSATGNVTAALDSGTDTVPIASGHWYVWATQAFKLSVQTSAGSIGATPCVYPPNTLIPIYVGEDSLVAHITRAGSTDGNYYFNYVIKQEY